jgi:predicted DNA-binding protein with PD1-like motif
MGRLAKGDDLLAAPEHCCRANGITLGEVRALGAVSQARVGYYDQAQRQNLYLEWAQPLEILALVGNISLRDGQIMVHSHVTLGDQEGRAWGGHLAEGTLVFPCEFMIQEYRADKTLERRFDQETGLFLWPAR